MAALSTLALLAVSAAKTGMQFSEERRAATQAERQGDFQAGLIRTNASLASAQADDAIARGNQAVSGVERSSRLIGGSQRAAFAAQGVDITSGSPSDVVSSDRALAGIDALTLKNNAAREAWGYKTQAASYSAQADWTQAAGKNAAAGLRRQSFGTLLGGAAELANIYASSPKGVGGAGSSTSVARPSFLPPVGYQKPVGWNG